MVRVVLLTTGSPTHSGRGMRVLSFVPPGGLTTQPIEAKVQPSCNGGFPKSLGPLDKEGLAQVGCNQGSKSFGLL